MAWSIASGAPVCVTEQHTVKAIRYRDHWNCLQSERSFYLDEGSCAIHGALWDTSTYSKVKEDCGSRSLYVRLTCQK